MGIDYGLGFEIMNFGLLLGMDFSCIMSYVV